MIINLKIIIAYIINNVINDVIRNVKNNFNKINLIKIIFITIMMDKNYIIKIKIANFLTYCS